MINWVEWTRKYDYKGLILCLTRQKYVQVTPQLALQNVWSSSLWHHFWCLILWGKDYCRFCLFSFNYRIMYEGPHHTWLTHWFIKLWLTIHKLLFSMIINNFADQAQPICIVGSSTNMQAKEKDESPTTYCPWLLVWDPFSNSHVII